LFKISAVKSVTLGNWTLAFPNGYRILRNKVYYSIHEIIQLCLLLGRHGHPDATADNEALRFIISNCEGSDKNGELAVLGVGVSGPGQPNQTEPPPVVQYLVTAIGSQATASPFYRGLAIRNYRISEPRCRLLRCPCLPVVSILNDLWMPDVDFVLSIGHSEMLRVQFLAYRIWTAEILKQLQNECRLVLGAWLIQFS